MLTITQRVLLVIDILDSMVCDGLIVGGDYQITDKGRLILASVKDKRSEITSVDILDHLRSQDADEEVAKHIAGLAVLHGYI